MVWNTYFNEIIKSYNFVQNVDESCIYRKLDGDNVSFFVLYVNDILFIENNIGILSSIKV
jgi:hypothetical protein